MDISVWPSMCRYGYLIMAISVPLWMSRSGYQCTAMDISLWPSVHRYGYLTMANSAIYAATHYLKILVCTVRESLSSLIPMMDDKLQLGALHP